MVIVYAKTPARVEQARVLFREYQEALGVDLGFQGFEEELAGLPGDYAPPKGALLLAVEGGVTLGCVALRNLGAGACEMKRLFVRPAHRRRGIGKALAKSILDEGVRLGYRLMRLDTLERLGEATALYESLGFKRIPPYYDNPLPGVAFMEVEL